MLRFVLTRLGHLIPTFIGVTIVAFAFIRLIPGDPIELLAGERSISPERHAALMAQFGYDKPLWQQYAIYLGDLLQGDLGKSIVTKRPVVEEFLTLFPATIELSLCAIVIAVLLGLPASAFWPECKRGSIFDHGVMTVSLTGYSMPIFWWGLLLIIFFSGDARLDAGVRPHLAAVLLRAGHRLHADRQPAVRREGRFRLGGQPPDPADRWSWRPFPWR